MMAVGALAALRARGLSVPGDVSLAGYDDLPLSRDMTPPLTTVRVPMLEMGRQAMRLAIAEPDAAGEIVRLPTELVVRESCGPPDGRNHRVEK